MGNTPGKESRSSGENSRSPASPSSSTFGAVGVESYSSRSGRGGGGSSSSRHEGSFLGIGIGTPPQSGLEVRKETRQEREARKLERERAARVKERERSIREESVDGGYLVTLGTYTGPEDFSKSVVRSLMIERRLAPFWRGLNDHSDSWTEHQLIAAAQGKPIPAPDEIPEDETITTPPPQSARALPVPHSRQFSDSSFLSIYNASTPQSTGQSPSSHPSSSPLFRGRAKTLASLASSSSKNHSQTDIVPQELSLPHEPFMNGMRIEAHLYKDVLECPICFLYYPPCLNKTRCCDQPICSECFVQIKRPDPHPPEHLDPNTPVPQSPTKPEDEGQLVSEPATCPFCVQAEFGVSYQPPPFRRGLVYAQNGPPMLRTNSAISSASESSTTAIPVGSSTSSNLTSRRRAESLSANSPSVITTDKVRPDWAKKLSDARAHQARRAAAATALHTAAYMMNNNQSSSSSGPFSRRRRAETTGSVNSTTNQAGPDLEQLMAALDSRRHPAFQRDSNSDLFPARGSSQRATSAQDLEEIMLMEAIRLSLAAEEERKKKEEKNAAKQVKQEEKQRAKEQKKAAKKGTLYPASANSSTVLSRLASNETPASAGPEGLPTEVSETSQADVKGKARSSDSTLTSSDESSTKLPVSMTPLAEPTSTINTEMLASGQQEQAASTRQEGAVQVQETRDESTPSNTATQGGALGSVLNFQSLAEIIGKEDSVAQSTAATTQADGSSTDKQQEEEKHKQSERLVEPLTSTQ